MKSLSEIAVGGERASQCNLPHFLWLSIKKWCCSLSAAGCMCWTVHLLPEVPLNQSVFFIHWCSACTRDHVKCDHVMLLIKLNPYSIFISIMLHIRSTDHNVNPQVKTRWRLCMHAFSLLMRSQARFLRNWNLCVCVLACLEADQYAHILIIVIVH